MGHGIGVGSVKVWLVRSCMPVEKMGWGKIEMSCMNRGVRRNLQAGVCKIVRAGILTRSMVKVLRHS
jgi:hypothetical protein